MHERSRKQLLVATAALLIIALGFLTSPAQAFTPSYYIETLGGRAKIVDGTVSGLLDAYDIFHQAMADSGANSDPAINGYYAVARMANILFREDDSTASLRNLLIRYGIILTGDSFSSGSPDEIEILEPVDYDDNIILPGDAPDTEAVRSFLATSMIQEINGALANLDVITNTPPFKEIIPAADIDSDTNLEIDYGDILLFKAVLKALKTGILIATAYDLDLDPHFLVMGINSEYGNFRQILDRFPDLLKLLPTATTSGDGASQLSLAETTLEAAIDDYLAASDEMRNDPGAEAGAEEFFAIGNCGLREEKLFRNMLSELKRSLQATDVANLIVYQEELWIIHDGSDPNKEMEVEFDETEGEFWSTNWPDLFLAGGGDVDCIIESGGTTTLYLALWDGPCSEGEATLTATYMDATTVSGDFSVDYYDDSNPSCTDHSGTFSGTREVFEETLNINLNPLFDNTPDLRDMLPDFDNYGEPLPGTMGNGLPGGPDPTLGGMLISSEEDGEVTSFTQDFWTQEFGFQPSGVVTIPTKTISLTDNVLSDWDGIDPVFEDIVDDEVEDIVGGDIADLYLAKDAGFLYIRMTLNDDPPSHDDWVYYRLELQYHNDETTGDLATVVHWDSSAADWRVVVENLGDGGILFDAAGGYAQEVGYDLEWKVPLSDVEPLTGRFIHAATEWWWDEVDYNGTRLLIGPVTTISGEIDNSFPTGVGALRVGVFRPGMPIDADHVIAGTFYIENEIDSNPFTYEIQDVPQDVSLVVLALWDHDLNGVDGPGDLWGGYSGNPLTLSGPRTDIDITLGQTFPAQISGTITYSAHSKTGDRSLTIWGSTDPSFFEHQVLFSQAVAPGSNPPIDYGLGGLSPDRYFLYYFLDLNQNNEPDLGEPFAYQGYHPPPDDYGYQFIPLLDLASQPEYPGVDVVLSEASRDRYSFNVYHEQRPNGPGLVVAYVLYAPFTAISSITVNGDGLLAPVDLTGYADEWHEYWRRIQPSSFQGSAIPTGEHTYTITVQATDGTTKQYSNTPDIDPLNWATQVAPADWATVSTTPTFQWTSVEGADRYRVEIVDQAWFRLYEGYTSPPDLTHTLPDNKIFPGESYRWRMTTFGPPGTDGTFDNRSRSGWLNFTVTPDMVTISGQVLDHNSLPLQGAKVEALLGGNVIASSTTDASGGYGLSVPVDNTYTIRLTAPGYARVSADTPGVVSGDLQGFDLGFSPADVDNNPPSISDLNPSDGSTVSEGRPEISAFLSDDHAGIDPSTIELLLDGTQVTGFEYSEVDGRLSFTPIANLANDSHTVTLDVRDYAQNPATQAAWSFAVDAKVAGDLNCDYSLDLADVIIALQVLIDNPPQTYCFSDVDGDGKIGLAEILFVLQKVAGFRSYQISYTYVQFRRFENNSTRYQIWVEVTDEQDNQAGDVLSSLEVEDPDGQILNFSYFSFSQSTDYVAHYNEGTQAWDEDLNGSVSRGYWGRIDTTSLDPGDYTFTAVDKSGDLLAPDVRNFSGAHPNLPVVDSNTINDTWHEGDGSLTIDWDLPVEAQSLDPDEWYVDVYIDVIQGGSGTGHGYFGKVPLDLSPQHVNLSSVMVSTLKSLGNELRCRVRIRKKDDSNRSYSNAVTIWKVPYINVIVELYPGFSNLLISTTDSFTSFDVTGPNITSTWNSDTFIAVSLSQRPNLGDTYEIHIDFSDGTSGDRLYTVTGMNDNFASITFPADNGTINTTTPTFTWQEATGIVTYGLSLAEVVGNVDNWIWWTSLPAGNNSTLYNWDGTGPDLQSGKTYRILLHTWDANGHQATTTSTFSIQVP